MDPVVHFEMPYEDRKRLAKFYKSAFGWQMQALGAEMGDYVTAATAETGKQGRPKTPGAINGGFFPSKPDWPAQYPSVVIGVADIRKSMKKVAQAGGKVLGEPMGVPGIGEYVSFLDSEGNRVSLLQPMPMGKPSKTARKKAAAAKPKSAGKAVESGSRKKAAAKIKR